MKELLYIFVGGGTGSVLRYLIYIGFQNKGLPTSFPWATFWANLGGCLLIGAFYSLFARFNVSPEIRLLLTVGLCGGFTTFSTFSNESLHLLREGLYATFAFYCIGSVVAGILAVWAGTFIGKP